jgi:hypothetical protein
MASADALRALTGDNAATLERRLQRPPTMADLALAHQQGAGTAANMLSGTGNASPRNLALNNVPAGAGPDAATAAVKGYYGMPERPVNPRDALAATVMQQQATAGGPQANPTPPVDAPIMAFDGSPSPSAMPTGSPVRSAPPARPITAAPRTDAPYVMPELPPTPRPVQVPMLDMEKRIRQKIESTPPADRQAVAEGLADYLRQAQEQRAFMQSQINEEYKTKETQRALLEMERQKQLEKAPETDIKLRKAPAEIRKLEAEAKDLEAKAEAGRIPTTRKLNDTDLQYDPKSGNWIMPPTAPGVQTSSAPDLNDAQSKLVQSYQKGKRALYNMGAGEALHSWTDWYGSGVPIVGNLLSSPDFQTQYQAADVFTNLVLRGETGAGALPSEIASTIRRFIPKPGSSPELIEQMRREREAILEGVRDSLGNKKRVLDPFDVRFAEEVKTITAAKAEALKNGKVATEKEVASTLPPVVIGSKAEKDALPRGRKYRLPTDPPDTIRVKKEHD